MSPDPSPGLCGSCRHVQVVETRNESRFYLCRRSRTDSRFPRYPRLPVLECPGYEPEPERPGEEGPA